MAGHSSYLKSTPSPSAGATQPQMSVCSYSCTYDENQGHAGFCFMVFSFCFVGMYVLPESMANGFVLPPSFSHSHNPRGPTGNREAIFLFKHYGISGQW